MDFQQAVAQIYSGLDSDFNGLIEKSPRPLLAHYTSMDVLEKIVSSDELWLSNPLFMNDLQEVRGGLSMSTDILFQSSDIISACGSQERLDIFRNSYLHYLSEFDTKYLLDVYVFCLSEHEETETDGRLSMWRGYGRNGNGAALIFNTDFITRRDEAPIIFAKVKYASDAERTEWLSERLAHICNIIKIYNIDDSLLHQLSFHYFNISKIASLTFKHHGFSEEREWRLIYMPDRDPRGLLSDGFHYIVGNRGVEPKLRLPIRPLPLDPPQDWTFNNILERIILGPSLASPLAVNSVRKMLNKIGKSEFCNKVTASGIPLRPS